MIPEWQRMIPEWQRSQIITSLRSIRTEGLSHGTGAKASQQTNGNQNPRERIPIPNSCGIRRKTGAGGFPEGTRGRGKTEAAAAQIMPVPCRQSRHRRDEGELISRLVAAGKKTGFDPIQSSVVMESRSPALHATACKTYLWFVLSDTSAAVGNERSSDDHHPQPHHRPGP